MNQLDYEKLEHPIVGDYSSWSLLRKNRINTLWKRNCWKSAKSRNLQSSHSIHRALWRESLLHYYSVYTVCKVRFLSNIGSFQANNVHLIVGSLADRYIRQGASGTGARYTFWELLVVHLISWTDALPSIPATLTRGETYWVADGNKQLSAYFVQNLQGVYTAVDFDDNVSGTQYIRIIKGLSSVPPNF